MEPKSARHLVPAWVSSITAGTMPGSLACIPFIMAGAGTGDQACRHARPNNEHPVPVAG